MMTIELSISIKNEEQEKNLHTKGNETQCSKCQINGTRLGWKVYCLFYNDLEIIQLMR